MMAFWCLLVWEILSNCRLLPRWCCNFWRWDFLLYHAIFSSSGRMLEVFSGWICIVCTSLFLTYFLYTLLFTFLIELFLFILNEGREDNEELIAGLPLVLISLIIHCDEIGVGLIAFQQWDHGVFKGRILVRHLLVKLDTLLRWVAVVVLLDCHIAASHAHHTVLTAYSHLFCLGTDKISVILFQLSDRHEGAE